MKSSLAARLSALSEHVPALREIFASLSGTHAKFQQAGALRSISVSDPSNNDAIEATFHGTRIKFKLICTLGSDGAPLGHVVCMHCHCTFGTAVQDYLGDFAFDADGFVSGQGQTGETFAASAPLIVMTFLERALLASRALGRMAPQAQGAAPWLMQTG